MITSFSELKKLFRGYDAYLVGGAARVLSASSNADGPLEGIKDWDVLVNHQVPPNLPGKWSWNSFGGIKYLELGLDVWQGDIGKHLRQAPRGKDGVAVHIETGAMLFTLEFFQSPECCITDRLVMTRKGLTMLGSEEVKDDHQAIESITGSTITAASASDSGQG